MFEDPDDYYYPNLSDTRNLAVSRSVIFWRTIIKPINRLEILPVSVTNLYYDIPVVAFVKLEYRTYPY